MVTIAFYGPDLSRASKVTVGIIHTEAGEAAEMRSWHSDSSDVRHDDAIGQAIVEFIDYHDVKSVAMSGGIIGCPTSKASITTQIGARFVISGRGGIASPESCYHDPAHAAVIPVPSVRF